MVSLDTWVPHGFPGLHQGFDNTITSSDSRVTNENDMVPQSVNEILDDEECFFVDEAIRDAVAGREGRCKGGSEY
nr:hypothetical protein CFP56_46440 [Quercus suber]